MAVPIPQPMEMENPGPATSASAAAVQAPPNRLALSPAMVAVMETQVEEMRKVLNKFKVCSSSLDPSSSFVPSMGGSFVGEGAMGDGIPAQAALPGHADILIFGPSGSGKSSLIRTFYMALNKTHEVPQDFAERIIVKDTAMNEGTLKYVSAVIKQAKHDHRGGIVSSAIMCHDTRGHIWMDEREQRQLNVMLDGGVKDDSLVQQRNYRYARLLWEFWKRDVDLFPNEILVRRSGLATKPHAILFVFDGSMEEIPDGEEETKFYRDIIAMTREKGYQYPQVVLTRIDRVEETLLREAAEAGEDPELKLLQALDRKIEGVVERLGISRASVHFTENYHSGTSNTSEGRNVSVDYHALKILTQCCSSADAFVAQSLHGGPRQSVCSIQ